MIDAGLNRKWIISQKGYANIVLSPGDTVYGLVYEMSDINEALLDRSEGVPYHYTKERMAIEFTPIDPLLQGALQDETPEVAVNLEVMVYVDRERTTPGVPWDEYIGKINKGITDGMKYGIPEGYFEKYLRPFIPPPQQGHGEPEVKDPFDPQLLDTLRFALSSALGPIAR